MANPAFSVFDVHCHLESFQAQGVQIEIPAGEFVVSSGFSHESNLKNAKIRDSNPSQIGLSCGIAPQEAMKYENLDKTMPEWLNFILQCKPNAIGEIGLDFHWAKNDEGRERQLVAFRAQLECAKKAVLPIVIHCRDAMPEVLDILEKTQTKNFMMHCFAGDENDARRVIDFGGIISIPPIRSKDRKKAIREAGLENIVVETDAPYLGPTKTLSDINVSVQIVSDALGVDKEKVMEKTTNNACNFYKVKP